MIQNLRKPLLSVIIPVFNGEKTIERTVKSIANQRCSNLIEIVIVNDGSQDNTKSVVERLKEKYTSILYVEQENAGVSAARNQGIQVARGEYINFCDADDWWVEDFFDDDVVKKLNGTDIIVFSRTQISPHYKYCRYEYNKNSYSTYDDVNPDRFAWEPPHCVFYRTELITHNQLAFDSVRYFEDILFCYKAFSLAKSIEHSDKLMYAYWMNPKSVLHNYDSYTQFKDAFSRFDYLTKWYKKTDIAYSVNEREQLSLIVTYLPQWCANYNWNKVKEIMAEETIDDLIKRDIVPWKNLKKTLSIWKKYPFLFYLLCKIYPGIYIRIRKVYFKNEAKSKFIEIILYRVIKRWERTTKSLISV